MYALGKEKNYDVEALDILFYFRIPRCIFAPFFGSRKLRSPTERAGATTTKTRHVDGSLIASARRAIFLVANKKHRHIGVSKKLRSVGV